MSNVSDLLWDKKPHIPANYFTLLAWVSQTRWSWAERLASAAQLLSQCGLFPLLCVPDEEPGGWVRKAVGAACGHSTRPSEQGGGGWAPSGGLPGLRGSAMRCDLPAGSGASRPWSVPGVRRCDGSSRPQEGRSGAELLRSGWTRAAALKGLPKSGMKRAAG